MSFEILVMVNLESLLNYFCDFLKHFFVAFVCYDLHFKLYFM
jgi:hypothetical protein